MSNVVDLNSYRTKKIRSTERSARVSIPGMDTFIVYGKTNKNQTHLYGAISGFTEDGSLRIEGFINHDKRWWGPVNVYKGETTEKTVEFTIDAAGQIADVTYYDDGRVTLECIRSECGTYGYLTQYNAEYRPEHLFIKNLKDSCAEGEYAIDRSGKWCVGCTNHGDYFFQNTIWINTMRWLFSKRSTPRIETHPNFHLIRG